MYKKSLLIPYVIKGLADFYFTPDFIEPKIALKKRYLCDIICLW